MPFGSEPADQWTKMTFLTFTSVFLFLVRSDNCGAQRTLNKLDIDDELLEVSLFPLLFVPC